MLRKEMEAKKAEDPLTILQKAADSAGVKLNIHGALPGKAEYRQCFLLAASEALTNAVFHAGARTLNVILSETELQWSVRFTNDGSRPAGPVIEGGGLSSLRRRLESIGATMTVESSPEILGCCHKDPSRSRKIIDYCELYHTNPGNTTTFPVKTAGFPFLPGTLRKIIYN